MRNAKDRLLELFAKLKLSSVVLEELVRETAVASRMDELEAAIGADRDRILDECDAEADYVMKQGPRHQVHYLLCFGPFDSLAAPLEEMRPITRSQK